MLKLKRKFKKSLLVCTSLLSILALGTPIAQAKRVHHHRNRTYKVHHHKRTRRKVKKYRTHHVHKRKRLHAHKHRHYVHKKKIIRRRKKRSPHKIIKHKKIIQKKILPKPRTIKYRIQKPVQSNNSNSLWQYQKKYLAHLQALQMEQSNKLFQQKRANHIATVNQENAVQQEYKKYPTALNAISQQDNPFDTAVRERLIEDINDDRAKNNLPPLQVDFTMQQVADYRAPKVLYAYTHNPDGKVNIFDILRVANDNWIHGADNHQTGADYLRTNNTPVSYWGANANATELGRETNYDGSQSIGNTNIPLGVADTSNDVYMNHDQVAHNGHRMNILNPKYTKLGVGVNQNTIKGFTTIADNEQFSD